MIVPSRLLTKAGKRHFTLYMERQFASAIVSRLGAFVSTHVPSWKAIQCTPMDKRSQGHSYKAVALVHSLAATARYVQHELMHVPILGIFRVCL